MLKIKQYIKAESLAQAYELNQKRTNRIIGGMLWLKMSNAQIQTAIDLSGLGLDRIEETKEEFRIGCMVTLRELELNQSLWRFSGGMIRESVKNIVGVQFRNLATIGGSLFGRFGFSDVLTCFLAMDTYVELYQGGIIPLEEFTERKRDNDILVRVIVKKTPGRYAYLSHRNTKTDFPVLTVAAACMNERDDYMKDIGENSGPGNSDYDNKNKCECKIRIVVGARPAKAICLSVPAEWNDRLGFVRAACPAVEKVDGTACQEEEAEESVRAACQEAEAEELDEAAVIDEFARELAKQVPTGSNMRASARYRSHLAEVLIKRVLLKVCGDRLDGLEQEEENMLHSQEREETGGVSHAD